MARPLRILHTADSHIGAGWPRRPRHQRPRRGDDYVDSYRRVLQAAARHDVDIVLHAGDLFDVPRPTSQALIAAAEPLLELAAGGITVVIVPGNHERSTIPAALLLAHANIHIFSEPRTQVFECRGGQRLAVSAFPCLRRRGAARFCEVLEDTAWRSARADFHVLAVHETFESAVCGPGRYRFRSGDSVVERQVVPAEFHYVACGHIHRHQALSSPGSGGPPLVYCGSPDRISFAEVEEPKGYVLLEAAGGRLDWRFIEHAVRPMSVWPLDITGLDHRGIEDHVAGMLDALPVAAVAQLRLSGSCAGDALSRVRFTSMAWSRRPDVLLTVSSRAVERVSRAQAVWRRRQSASPFACLLAAEGREMAAALDDLATLPNTCGVYAMHDGADRLLYVGKTSRLRTRVRSHLNGANGNFFSGWGRQAARVRVRLADSELEALLLEAELIRRLRPPFNRQMRQWPRYCYLVGGQAPYGQLEIRRHPPPRGQCFGPFRGRRWAETLCEALAVECQVAQCPESSDGGGGQLTLFGDHPAARLCARHHAGV